MVKPDVRIPASRLEKVAWEQYKAAENAAGRAIRSNGHRAAFYAGFRAGLIEVESMRSQIKTFESLKQRSLDLQARVIELQNELRDLRKRFRRVRDVFLRMDRLDEEKN